MNNSSKILLTGGNGYIARSILAALTEHKITAICRQDVDLLDATSVKTFFNKSEYYDVVIHTAITGGRRTIKENSLTIDQNLKMYYNILDNKDKFNKFISFGSGAEMYTPDTPYGLSKKVIAESMIDKPNFYNLRIFAVFDHNELCDRFIKSNIIRYIKREPMVIHHDKKMDFFFMEDLMNLVNFYINTDDPPKETNCSYIQKYTLMDIANIINTLSDYKVPISPPHIKGEDYIGAYNLPNYNVIGLKLGIIKTYKYLTTINI